VNANQDNANLGREGSALHAQVGAGCSEESLADQVLEGLQDGEFFIAYQPVVNARTRGLLGVECLIRWQHPKFGLLLPGSFIHAFENRRAARAVSYFVLESACQQLADLRRTGVPLPRVAINIQPGQLEDEELGEKIFLATARHGINPSLIELELVETEDASRLLSNPDRTRSLKELGVRFALDDFGSGYSSLAMLGSTHIDTVKLAREFLLDVPASPRACAIVNGILDLLDKLGFAVVVEGVETQEQLHWLTLHPRVYVQGHYIARPQARFLQAVAPLT
jgi:EAL domain-containing protein (putative c-di-GMP-specific phosphodiesterase class I)